MTKYTLRVKLPKFNDFVDFPGLIHKRDKHFEEYLAGVVDKLVRFKSLKHL